MRGLVLALLCLGAGAHAQIAAQYVAKLLPNEINGEPAGARAINTRGDVLYMGDRSKQNTKNYIVNRAGQSRILADRTTSVNHLHLAESGATWMNLLDKGYYSSPEDVLKPLAGLGIAGILPQGISQDGKIIGTLGPDKTWPYSQELGKAPQKVAPYMSRVDALSESGAIVGYTNEAVYYSPSLGLLKSPDGNG